MANHNVYAQSGVNIAAGDDFSAFAGAICAESYHNSPFVEIVDQSAGRFRGVKGWRFKDLPEGYVLDAAPDGIGTKVVIIDADHAYPYAAHNLIAMTAGDITRYGGKPLVFSNVLDVASLGKANSNTRKACMEMMRGLGTVAKEQGFVLYRGETAELGPCVGSENPDARVKFNWAGFMIGVWHPDRVITGEHMRPGNVVIALRERGPRSNGISAVRNGLRSRLGTRWWNNASRLAIEYVRQAALPATLYDKFLSEMNGWSDQYGSVMLKMNGIAHISGGGIVDKFGEDLLFRYGLSAELDDLFNPPDILRMVVEETGMQPEETYQTFSSGVGALVVVDEVTAERFVVLAKDYGIKAKVCGKLTQADEPHLTIHSRYDDSKIVFHPKTS